MCVRHTDLCFLRKNRFECTAAFSLFTLCSMLLSVSDCVSTNSKKSACKFLLTYFITLNLFSNRFHITGLTQVAYIHAKY